MKKKEMVDTMSDLTTTGVIGEIMKYVFKLPPDIQTIVSMAFPVLACGSNLVSRTQANKLYEKDMEKIDKLVTDIENRMKARGIEELKNFVNLDFPIEIHCVVEEVIKEAINAKGEWLRTLAAEVIVVIGSDYAPNRIEEKRLCLKLIKELDENDLKLLILYNEKSSRCNEKSINSDSINDLKKELVEDQSIFAQSILISADNLKRLGLVKNEVSLYPQDEKHKNNKEEMIDHFLNRNAGYITPHFLIFIKYLYIYI